MTLTRKALRHNRPAFLAALKEVAAIRRLHNDNAAALEIERTVITLEAGAAIETEWTINIARRFIHHTA